MKKDFSQLGIIPSVALAMLTYSSGIGLLRWFSDFFGIPLQTSSVGALETYRITLAVLAALVPWLVLLIGLRKYGTHKPQSFGWYIFGVLLLLSSIIGGLAIEMVALDAFQRNVKELVPDQQWVFSIEELHPFKAGFGGLVISSAVLFLTAILGKRRNAI